MSTGQRQAAQDAQLLKSIVEPLEEQIGALKQKLRDTDLLLVESEKRQAKSTLGMSALTTWLSGQASLDQALLALKEKQSELLTFSELKSKEQVWSLTLLFVQRGRKKGGGRSPQFLEQRKELCFSQTHNHGLHLLFLTLSWVLRA